MSLTKIPQDEKHLYVIPFAILSFIAWFMLDIIFHSIAIDNLFWGGFSYALVMAIVVSGCQFITNQRKGYPDYFFLRASLFFQGLITASTVPKRFQNWKDFTIFDNAIIQLGHALPYVAVYGLLLILHRKKIVL